MCEKPILFKPDMIRAILEGRKYQTRRIMNPQPVYDPDLGQRIAPYLEGNGGWVWQPRKNTKWFCWDDCDGFDITIEKDCPYGGGGTRLWVRETWAVIGWAADLKTSEMNPSYFDQLVFKADVDSDIFYDWRASIHMPRWASRIDLKNLGVRVERIQDISEADAVDEGVEPNWIGDNCPEEYLGEWRDYSTDDLDVNPCFSARESFQTLWDKINKKRGFGWEINPWVWVVNFNIASVRGVRNANA